MPDDQSQRNIDDLLNDIPETEMDEGSRELLRDNPIDWSVSKGRALRMAIGVGDEDMVNQIVDDVAHVLGKRGAEQWKLMIWGRMVEEEMTRKMEEDLSDEDNLDNSD